MTSIDRVGRAMVGYASVFVVMIIMVAASSVERRERVVGEGNGVGRVHFSASPTWMMLMRKWRCRVARFSTASSFS